MARGGVDFTSAGVQPEKGLRGGRSSAGEARRCSRGFQRTGRARKGAARHGELAGGLGALGDGSKRRRRAVLRGGRTVKLRRRPPRRFSARGKGKRGSRGCARQGEEREQEEGGGGSLMLPEARKYGGGQKLLRRGIPSSSGYGWRKEKRGMGEGLEGYTGEETGQVMRALNALNHGEESTGGGRGGFQIWLKTMTSADVINFSFSVSEIFLKFISPDL